MPDQPDPKKFRAAHLTGSRRIAHAARNYRPDLKSDSYLFREKKERKRKSSRRDLGGKRSINCFSLSPVSLRASGICLKNPLSLWPRRDGRVSAYVSVINHAFSSQPVSVNYARPFIADSSRPGSPTGPVFYISIRDTPVDLREPSRRYFSLFFPLALSLDQIISRSPLKVFLFKKKC